MSRLINILSDLNEANLKTPNLPGVQLFESAIHRDNRGEFREIFQPDLLQSIGVDAFVQVNYSQSRKNVFRGLHLQLPPRAQGKLITCLRGSIKDYVLDPNPGSDTYGQISSFELSRDNGRSLWIPGGYAHGFLSFEEDTLVVYAVTKPWDKNLERSIAPGSTLLANLLDLKSLILSEKDRSAPSLEKFAEELNRRTEQ